MPTTGEGSAGRKAFSRSRSSFTPERGVPGVDVPGVALFWAAPSTATRYAASVSLTSVTERSQSDFPVEMTTWHRGGGRAGRSMMVFKWKRGGRNGRCGRWVYQITGSDAHLSAIGLHRAQHLRSGVYHRHYLFRIFLVAWTWMSERAGEKGGTRRPSSQGLGQFLQSAKDTGTPAASRGVRTSTGSSRRGPRRMAERDLSGGDGRGADPARRPGHGIRLDRGAISRSSARIPPISRLLASSVTYYDRVYNKRVVCCTSYLKRSLR
ncbi:hypothetical protein OF83DRAFT_518957 [Amylostereum chailletii]|nr:hypothetical protein OF83DRAFT_518957 [Amylostereum chailletii]